MPSQGRAGRLTRRIVDRDPPTVEQFAELNRAADEAFAWTPSRQPSEVVFVGGTATNLLKLLRRAGNPDRDECRAMVDAALATATLLGLTLNAVAGWWWADVAAGVVIVAYGLREGIHLLGES